MSISTLYYDVISSEIGDILIVGSDTGLQRISFHDKGYKPIMVNCQHAPGKLRDAVMQITEYLKGKRRTFDLSLSPQGTPFQEKVWRMLCDIPYGETITYKELAEWAESPKACRAVGNANGKNPLVIVQPCHRVIASGGKIGGFSSGISRKKYLLALEKGVHPIF